jgi:thiol-disulfide isomerase/thioredoxin
MDRRKAGQQALAAVAALTVGSAKGQESKTEHTRLAVDSEAPSALGRRRDGNPLSLAELADQVVVVCFWAAWCPHCRNELPFLEKLQMAGKGALTVVAVNIEDSSTFRRVARELSELKMTLTHDSNKTVGREWLHDGTVPYTLVVDRTRRVRTALYGWGDSGQTAVLAAVNASLSPSTEATPSKGS